MTDHARVTGGRDRSATTVPWATLEVPAAPAPWTAGGVSDLDGDRFREHFNAHRQELILTPPQIADALDALVRADAADTALLEPTTPPALRLQALGRVLRPAIERGQIRGLTLCDEATLRAVYDATLSWGPHVQPLLDDPSVTEVKIIGCAALAESTRGPIVVPQAYAAIDEPLSRAQALAQIHGVTWDASRPSVTLALPNKVRLHMTRRPALADDDLLLVIRRGRTEPWTIDHLVQRQAISTEAAALLRALVEARLSLVVSGVQGSGKTTVLECALNTLPPTAHLVVIEDNTDEFALAAPLVSRLRVNASGAETVDPYADIVRETLRMTPDVVVPAEIRGAEAGAVVQIAEAGRPTATTIHGDTPEGALLRLATMAATDVSGNRFARQTGLALRVLARAFHAIVHVTLSATLNRRIVESVHLLDGVGPDGEPRLLPVITASIAAAGDGLRHTVGWTCHAQLVGDTLVWDDAGRVTPAPIARRLADRPALLRRSAARETAAESQVSRLLGAVRLALDTDPTGEAAAHDLARAHRLTPDHPEVWALAERLLTTRPALRAEAEAAAAERIAAAQAALAARDLGAARAAVQPGAELPILVQAWLRQDDRWQATGTAVTQFAQLVEAFEDASAAAHTYATSEPYLDFARALACLQPFAPEALPRPQAIQLVEARVRLLTALIREQPTAAQRPLWEQQLAEARAVRQTVTDTTLPLPAAAPTRPSVPLPDALPVELLPSLPAEPDTAPRRPLLDTSTGDLPAGLEDRVTPDYRTTLARLAERHLGGES